MIKIKRMALIIILLSASSGAVIAYRLNIEGRRLHNLGVDMYVGKHQTQRLCSLLPSILRLYAITAPLLKHKVVFEIS